MISGMVVRVAWQAADWRTVVMNCPSRAVGCADPYQWNRSIHPNIGWGLTDSHV